MHFEDAAFFVEDSKLVHPTAVLVLGVDLYDLSRKLLVNRGQNLRQRFGHTPLDIAAELILSVFAAALVSHDEHWQSEDDRQAGDVRTESHGLRNTMPDPG